MIKNLRESIPIESDLFDLKLKTTIIKIEVITPDEFVEEFKN
jgi:hypothetical protein